MITPKHYTAVFFAVTLFVASLFVLAIPALAGGKPEKVDICHVTDSRNVVQNQFTTVVGHVINVSEKSVDSHKAHGDFEYTDNNEIDFGPVIFNLTWRQITENLGLNLEGVNCAGFVLDF